MSRQNKVNPDHYKVAGRLSPDDLARERRKQSEPWSGAGRARARKAIPPWMRQAAERQGDREAEGAAPTNQAAAEASPTTARDEVSRRRPAPKNVRKSAPPRKPQKASARKQKASARKQAHKAGSPKKKSAKQKTGRASRKRASPAGTRKRR